MECQNSIVGMCSVSGVTRRSPPYVSKLDLQLGIRGLILAREGNLAPLPSRMSGSGLLIAHFMQDHLAVGRRNRKRLTVNDEPHTTAYCIAMRIPHKKFYLRPTLGRCSCQHMCGLCDGIWVRQRSRGSCCHCC